MPDAFIPDAANARAFRAALGSFPTGVTIVTCIGTNGAPVGITANSFASVSLDPPLVLWSPAKSSSRHDHFLAAEAFAIHVLAEDQSGVCMGFTRSGSDFSGVDVTFNAEGVPVFSGAVARFDCVREAAHDGGDHTIIVGRVLRVEHRPAAALCFAGGQFRRLTSGD